MNTTIQLDLAQVLERQYPKGFHVPADIELSTFLEFGDDDWTHELDLDVLLVEQEKALLLFTAQDAQRVRPHLTDEQAWEVAQATRDEFRDALTDFLGDVADARYPTAKFTLEQRTFILKRRLTEQLGRQAQASELLTEVVGLKRLISRIPEGRDGNPALEGSIAVTLDDVEQTIVSWEA